MNLIFFFCVTRCDGALAVSRGKKNRESNGFLLKKKIAGLVRDLNPGPLAP